MASARQDFFSRVGIDGSSIWLRPGGRLSTLYGHEHAGQPIVLTEFGGIAYAPRERRNGTWGYSVAESSAELARAYSELLRTVRALPLLAGFCYTRFADTNRETNGLLYADRTPKFSIEQIAEATRGSERWPYTEIPRQSAASDDRPAEISVQSGEVSPG